MYPYTGCVTTVAFRCSYAAKNAFRPASVNWHASRHIMKSSGVSISLLISVSTTLSAITGRNSSIRSSASDGLPCRSWWKNPLYGSNPTVHTAAKQSFASIA